MTKFEGIEFLTKRLNEARKEYNKVSLERVEAQRRENELSEEIKGWERSLAAERRRTGIVEDEPTPASRYEVDLVDAMTSTNGDSAAQRIADFIKSTGATGATRSDIREFLSKSKIVVHRNYPYVVVDKLKKATKIVEEKDRLYDVNKKAAS